MKIVENKNYMELVDLFTECGLEIHLQGNGPRGFITCWKAEDSEGKLIGGVSIEKKEGIFAVGDIAVSEPWRNKDLGGILLETALGRIEELGGKEVYLVAKAPKFFEKFGFDYITPDQAPPFTNCLDCDQFQVKCFPKLMKFSLPKA